MVHTGSSTGYGTSSGYYGVAGYASSYGSFYGVKKNIWKKSHCCGARNFATPCSDCPG
jgi:hypothetical protein